MNEIKKKPEWLKIPFPTKQYHKTKKIINELKCNTVCLQAKCPNSSECFSKKHATFMILGNTCTRNCRFCNVETGKQGDSVDKREGKRIANAVEKLNLNYAVLTSVDRDDLIDENYGANHFSECITEIKKINPDVLIEVLIPDFNFKKNALKKIIKAKPDVIAHNIETVKELQSRVRDAKASYEKSLKVLNYFGSSAYTKSGLMLGFGETKEQVMNAMDDLIACKVDFLTLGQYLQPTSRNLPVESYVKPEEFDYYRKAALKKGFLYCQSSPFTRSSYLAGEFFIQESSNNNE